ncbi:Protein of uncharacterised function (DUF1602) [Streptococcus pneumoniae]|nr:Protein of uncharacterised function (DUF1602) [Streptococcus pneumoniae]
MTIWPRSRNITSSTCSIPTRWCVIQITVFSSVAENIVSIKDNSVFGSKPIVGSSSTIIGVSCIRVLAKATLCLSPPENRFPISCIFVCNPSGREVTCEANCAFSKAFHISSSVASGLPIRTLFPIVVSNKCGF